MTIKYLIRQIPWNLSNMFYKQIIFYLAIPRIKFYAPVQYPYTSYT